MITDGTSFPVILKLSGKLGGLVRHRIPLTFVPGCFFSSLLYICLWDFLNFLLHQDNILSAFNSKQIVASVVKIVPGNEIFLQFCLTSKLLFMCQYWWTAHFVLFTPMKYCHWSKK